MAQDTVRARIRLKNDTEANWNKSHFIPLKGEVIVYTTDESHPFSRLKIGDGNTYINDLPFVSSENNGDNNYIKSKTTAEWQATPQYVPIEGEPIFYIDENETPKIKIGDGQTYVSDLPFLNEILTDMQSHINDITMHITDNERNYWNNKISCYDNIVNENLTIIK